MSKWTPARGSWGMAWLVCGLAAACGDDKTGSPGDVTRTDTSDIFVPSDTGTGTTTDTATTSPTDTATTSPTDTATTSPTDTVTADTEQDTAIETDTTVADTTTADDTTVADTTTTQDTFVADTTVADTTTTQDTTVADTTPGETTGTCPNGVIDPGEQCDGAQLGGATCESLGFAAGAGLACADDCTSYDFGGCQALCGNGTIDVGEVCDGAALPAVLSCDTFGYDGGALGCTDDCLGVVTTACTTTASCGNNTAEGPESCDGTDLGVDDLGAALTCEDFGFDAGGVLACRADCGTWVLSGCGQNIPGWTCPPDYFGDGDCDCGCGVVDVDCGDGGVSACVYCNDPGSCATEPGCGEISAANTGVCEGTVVQCGNDVAGPGEMCDGDDVRGVGCTDLGFDGGDIGCTQGCVLDVEGCTELEVPAGWTCSDEFYGDDECDCGCGVKDVDCAGTADVNECDWCDSCQLSLDDECLDVVDPTDTTLCLEPPDVPEDWTCADALYDDGECDCGCGVQDADCLGTDDVEECIWCDDCGTGDCADLVDPLDTTLCAEGTEPPEGWTCPDGFYGDDDCDCGCGAQDIDCAGTDDVTQCNFCTSCQVTFDEDCADVVDGADTTQCVDAPVVPDGWTCSDNWYDDGGCDCGCGVIDADCTTDDDISECTFCGACDLDADCEDVVDPLDTTQCLELVPDGWTCNDDWYDDGGCDCGCGVKDIDCATDDDISQCTYCLACSLDADCVDVVDPLDTTQCLAGPEIPAGWTCGDILFDDGDCDCGCGAADADCASDDPALCVYCDGCGGEGDCVDRVSADDPTVCLAPFGWSCDLDWYGDLGCDCGCGVQDEDCLATDDISECAYCLTCGGLEDEACEDRVDNDDTTVCVAPGGWICEAGFYGDVDCDCGCGVQDEDCTATDDATECEFCDRCEGSGTCEDLVVPTDTTMCLSDIPAEWLCPDDYYNDGTCDCGCGAQDLDCDVTDDLGECVFCEACGVDPTESCEGAVDPDDTTLCLP